MAAMIILLTREQMRLLIEETKKRYPIEACGVLFGKVENGEAVVVKIMTFHNVLESPTDFQIDPEEFLRALSEAEKEGTELLGFFHSHPARPHPSSNDLRHMKLWPGNIWVIISSTDYGIAAYRIVDDDLQGIEIKTDYHKRCRSLERWQPLFV